MNRKKDIIILIPLLENIHYQKPYYQNQLFNFLYSLINQTKTKSIYSFFKKRYILSFFNFNTFNLDNIESNEEVLDKLYTYLHELSISKYEYNISFKVIIDKIKEISKFESTDKIFCFTITSNIEVYKRLKPYIFFEKTNIIYRNIDISSPAFLSMPSKSISEEKLSFYDIKMSSDIREFAFLFNSKDNKFKYGEWSKVFLGYAAPEFILSKKEFIIYFFAHIDKLKNQIKNAIKNESLNSNIKTNVEKSNWKIGTKISVRCYSENISPKNSIQSFEWNGSFIILKFDLKTVNTYKFESLIIKIDVLIKDLVIAKFRPEILIKESAQLNKKVKYSFEEKPSPETAFASYSHLDQIDVMSRISTITSFFDIDVFVDCLSIKNNEKWKIRIDEEIGSRDDFWLFWSKNAKESKYVEYEWKKALEIKTIDDIKIAPLETFEMAPPPNELSELQVGGLIDDWIQLKKKKE